MLQNLSIIHWIGIAIVAIIALHGFGIFDATKIPMIGGLFAKILAPFKPKNGTTPVTTVSRVGSTTNVSAPVVVDTLPPIERCQVLKNSLVDVRHLISERPTERVAELLAACDSLEKEIEAFHEEHTAGSGY